MTRGIKLDSDGAIVRLHNKRIEFMNVDGKTMINMRFKDDEPDKPACLHRCIKGKIRETWIQLSTDAMEALVISYCEYKRNKNKK